MSDGPSSERIHVLLADSQPLVLDALDRLLRAEPDIDVVGRCHDGAEALALVRERDPDILILDLNLPGTSGLDVLREMRRDGRRTRAVLLSAYIRAHELVDALRMGIRGVLLKDGASEDIVRCVRAVRSGGEWIEPQTAARVMQTLMRHGGGDRSATDVLTARERQLVSHVVAGRRNREIAELLHISEGTVKIHLHNVYEKLGLHGRVDLTVWAKDKGIV